MESELTKHNVKLKELNETLMLGQTHKLRFELFLVSVEDGIENGKLQGARLKKAEELAESIEWALKALNDSQNMLIGQANLLNRLNDVVQLVS